MLKFVKQLSHESVVELIGVVSLPKKPLTGTTQQVEIHVTKMYCFSRSSLNLPLLVEDAARSEADIEKSVKVGKPAARVLQDTRFNNRFLDLRTPANQALFRIQCHVQIAFREFLLSKGFLEIHTPKLIAGSSEGGSAVFRLDYKGQPACLAQSPQLHKQMAICGDMRRVFEVGPVFRAEDSFTHRHLCEFVGLDVEMEIRMHYSEIMDLVGDLFPFIFTKIEERCPKELETVRKQYPFQSLKFLPQTLRLTFAQGIQMLKEAGEEVDPLGDLNTESERKLGQLVLEKYKTEFYMLHRYPSAVRPFYTMPCEDDSNYSNSFDVFIRGEEIMSGAQRIHDPELLEKRARECGIDVKTISTYIDGFRYGAPPHGGFGVGLERVMATVTPSSISKPWLVPGAAFTVKKNDCSIKCCFSRKAGKHIPPSTQRLVLPLSTSLKLFPTHGRHFVLHPHRTRATTETDLVAAAVEGQDSPPVPETDANDKSDDSAPPTSRGTARPGRKSEMPAVKNEELVAGATFTGKVRAIQPFGAFIDFGAFTDGLVHVSQLSDTFVKDVASVVSIGQEVKVRLVEADIEAKRISLTMRSNDDPPKRQSGGGDNKPRPGGKRGGQKKEDGFSSKYVKGQMLDGTVKNLTRSGAFITIGEGEEGFLPTNEEADDGIGSMMMGGGSSLQAEQEVKVRVLRIARGRVTLTMKEEDDGKFDETLSQGVVHTATNPFVLAFRKNEEIAAFLDKREEEAEKPVEPVKESEEAITSEKVDESLSLSPEEVLSETPKVEEEEVIETKAEEETEEQTETLAAAAEVEEVEKVEETPDVPPVPETKSEEEVSENSIPQSSATDEVSSPEAVVSEDVEKKEEVVAEVPVAETVPDEVPSSEAVATEDVEKKEEVVAGVPVAEAIPDEVSSPEAVASEDVEKVAEVPVAEAETPAAVVTEASTEESGIKAGISPALVKQLREETGAGMMDCKNALLESEGDMVKAQEYLRKKGLASADKKASRATAEGRIGSYIHDSRIGVLLEVNCETDFVSRGDIFKELVDDLAMQVAACPQVEYLVPEDVSEEIVMKEKEIEMQKEDLLSKPEQIREKIVEGRIKKRVDALALLEQPYIKDDKVIVKDLVKQRIATIGENIKVKRFIRYTLGEGLEKKSQDFAAEVAAQTAAKPKAEPEKEQPKAEELPKEAVPSPPTAVVSAGLVKQLREETGAGMMDCKKALAETGGDLEKAQEYLRKKGLSTADKKSSRLAAEGRIGSYIHDARIGVLIEVNCETDFVGRSEKFKELVDDLAMQAVANPQVQYVSIEDIPEEIKQKEKEIEMQREDLESKPENIKEKIVEGRISKRLGEMALLEQPFIKDDSVLVKDLVKQTVATLGENIKVRRKTKKLSSSRSVSVKFPVQMNFGLPSISWFNSNSSKKDATMVETVTSTTSLLEQQDQGQSLFGIKIWTFSLGSVFPWAATSPDGKQQKPTTINRGLKRHAVSRRSSRVNTVSTVYRFRPYVSKVPWHTGPRALLSQLFPRYGHYCGPNWSSGKDGGSPIWDQRPIDWLDHCCYCHDIGYDTHDQAELLKADLAFLECLESNKRVVTKGDAHVAHFYKTMCITGLKNILIPYRSYLVKIQYGQNLLDFGWLVNSLSKRSWNFQKN
ncbi:unnamed protein product [Brassica oleracea]